MSDYITKRCCRCKSEMPADVYHFHRNRHTKDGLHPECIWCREDQRPKSGKLAPVAILYDGEKKRCTLCQEWLPATTDYFDAVVSRKDGLHPRCKECRATEKKLDRINNGYRPRSVKAKRNAVVRAKIWAQENPEKARRSRRAQVLRYRARKKSLADEYTPDDWSFCLDWFNGCCAYCGSQQSFWYTIEADHVIPLENESCPGTIATNIVPACRSCNSSKSDGDMGVWLIQRYGKRKAKQILQQLEEYFMVVTDRTPHE